MGIMNTYPNDDAIADNDRVMGPNSDGATKNYTFAQVRTYLGFIGTELSLGSLVASGDITDNGTKAKDFRDESTFDFVASGLVWSGDSYGSTRVASMTAGIVYIDGKRVSVTAVTARTFTASKDTYVDVGNDGTVYYSEVANNAASPGLTANRVRIGIIITGAGSIANAGSVNQGQEDKVLPIASSVPYSVTDSLGNLICPRDPQRRLLGYRQSLTTFSTASTTAVQITGLSCPVTVPTGRRVRVTVNLMQAYNASGGQQIIGTVWDGTVGSGTQLGLGVATSAGASFNDGIMAIGYQSPTSSSKTYNAGLHSTSGATVHTNGAAGQPASIYVELL